MAYFDKQRENFASSLASAAAKINVKRPVATPASPSPSVASTTSVTTPSKKAKREGDGSVRMVLSQNGAGSNAPTIFSQPENTGVGSAIGTNIVYALDYLKQQGGKAVSLATVLGHLSLDREPEAFRRQVVERMRHHPRITWRPDAGAAAGASGPDDNWQTGTYEHLPVIPNVKDRTTLLQHLQRRTDAQGVNVKDLKDGWPDCEATLAALEKEHRILVVRTKKDNHPRMVWLDDPSLCHEVESEFQALWHRSEVPSLDDIVRKLAAAGQKPTSEDPRLRDIAAPKEKKQKKRAQRRTGKSTNTHMEHLLKDYSHMKR